jgi:hypothetical protein
LQDPRAVGHPQSRERVYILMFSRALLAKCGINEDDCYRLAIENMDAMANCHGMVPLESLLLPESSQLIKDMLDADSNAIGIDSTPDDALWPAQHIELATSQGIAWWRPSPITNEIRTKFPGIAVLGERQLDILVTAGVGFPEGTTRLVESSQRVDRVTYSSHESTAVKCVIPRMRRWITSRCRILHGAEALALQGIYFAPSVLTPYSSSLLFDIAGNAFHSGCAALATMTVFATLAIGMHHSASRLPPTVSQAQAPDIEAEASGDVAPYVDVGMDELLAGW